MKAYQLHAQMQKAQLMSSEPQVKLLLDQCLRYSIHILQINISTFLQGILSPPAILILSKWSGLPKCYSQITSSSSDGEFFDVSMVEYKL